MKYKMNNIRGAVGGLDPHKTPREKGPYNKKKSSCRPLGGTPFILWTFSCNCTDDVVQYLRPIAGMRTPHVLCRYM